MRKKFPKIIITMQIIISFCLNLVAFSGNMAVFAEDAPDSDIVLDQSENNSEDNLDLNNAELPPLINLPGNMRGVTLEISALFSTNLLSDTLDSMIDIGITTVIIPTYDSDNNTRVYDTDMNKKDADIVSAAAELARARYMSVFFLYNIAEGGEDLNDLVSDLHRFVLKYPCDGIIFTDYYSENVGDFSKYMLTGSGIGYENWLCDAENYRVKTAADVVRKTDNAVAIGTLIEQNPEDMLRDGYCDLPRYISEKLIDFVLVSEPYCLTSEIRAFGRLAIDWSAVCSLSGVPMYILHDNARMGENLSGWREDQLLRQLSYAKDITGYKGSAFASAGALSDNPQNSTATLKAYYADKIDEESLFTDLTMFSPKNLSFPTYEPVVDFSGRFDKNFDVYFNGDRIELNEAGNFYFEKPLQIGPNSFTITHKGRTYKYNIERKVIALKSIDASIEEGNTLAVEGGTKIMIDAVAYKGATVTATLNGKYITLKELSTPPKDEDPNTSYASFSGYYKVPEGIVGEAQYLGNLTVTGKYAGYSRTATGASVVVNAKPRPPAVEIESEMYDQQSAGTGEVVGVIDPVKTSFSEATLLRLNHDYTNVYDGKTTGAALNPLFSQLPASTLDYYLSTSEGYYLTESGRRFKQDDVTLENGFGLDENNLVMTETGTRNGDSYFKLALDRHITFNIQTGDNHFYNEWGGSYNLSGGFTASYVTITFDNITSVTKIPDLSANAVFSRGEWQTVAENGIPKFVLTLQLKRAGVYLGHAAFYDDNGLLTLCFENPPGGVYGLNIVIDPGHGYGKSETKLDPGAIGHVIEQEVNLAIAEKLTTVLTNMGANVVRLPTESQYILTKTRPVAARNYGCDIFISLHSNKIQGNDAVRGSEAYYFTPYSEPLAKSIANSLSAYFTNNVYADGGSFNRGAKYEYWDVCLQQDFPSTLVEMGFVSNYEEAMALGNPEKQQGIAEAIAEGIVNFCGR